MTIKYISRDLSSPRCGMICQQEWNLEWSGGGGGLAQSLPLFGGEPLTSCLLNWDCSQRGEWNITLISVRVVQMRLAGCERDQQLHKCVGQNWFYRPQLTSCCCLISQFIKCLPRTWDEFNEKVPKWNMFWNISGIMNDLTVSVNTQVQPWDWCRDRWKYIELVFTRLRSG